MYLVVTALLALQYLRAEVLVTQDEAQPFICDPKKSDGFYKNPYHKCSRVFFACANGDSFKEYCNPGLAYDERSNQCLNPVSIPECLEANVSTTVQSLTTISPEATSATQFLCPGIGNYPDPNKNCSSLFFICGSDSIHGHSFRCAKRTYYDPELKQCDFFLNIPICSGQPRTTTLSTTPGTTTVPILDCTDKADGNYPVPNLDCPSFFIQCANKRTFPTNCPGILRYNPYVNQCLGPHMVPGCPGAPPADKTTSTIQPVTQPLSTIDCAGLGDGYHQNPSQLCSDIYYVCQGTTAILLRCPFGTRFNRNATSCLFPINVPDCNSDGIGVTIPASSKTVPTTTRQIRTTQPPEPEFLFPCNESFGTFPDPQVQCSNVYYVCGPDSWVGHKFRCPSDTIYDPELNLCDLRESVPRCTGQPRTTSLPKSTGTTLKPEIDCLYRADGNYIVEGAICPQVFYQCANGETFTVDCPGNLKYDLNKDQCLPSVMVPGCPGGPPVPSTTFATTVKT